MLIIKLSIIYLAKLLLDEFRFAIFDPLWKRTRKSTYMVKVSRRPNSSKLAQKQRFLRLSRSLKRLPELLQVPDTPVECFIEDKESPSEKSATTASLKIEKRSHVHCHRCKKVAVAITYNGKEEKISVPPQTVAEKIFKLAIKAFNISSSDRGSNLVLRLDNGQGQILQDDDHIGSFVNYPACHITLFLTPKKQVQG